MPIDGSQDGRRTCLRCLGHNITVRKVYLGGSAWSVETRPLYTIIECADCNKAEMDRTIKEIMASRPDLATRYAKVKLRTDYYGTVTIKGDDDDGQGT